MATDQNHRMYAARCVEQARAAGDETDKALWMTLAASWLRLAGHVAADEPGAADNESDLAVQATD